MSYCEGLGCESEIRAAEGFVASLTYIVSRANRGNCNFSESFTKRNNTDSNDVAVLTLALRRSRHSVRCSSENTTCTTPSANGRQDCCRNLTADKTSAGSAQTGCPTHHTPGRWSTQNQRERPHERLNVAGVYDGACLHDTRSAPYKNICWLECKLATSAAALND